MITAEVFPDDRGSWWWEVSDEVGIYLRSNQRFDSQLEALHNLREETHLFNPKVTMH